jgi:hypothetical protein
MNKKIVTSETVFVYKNKSIDTNLGNVGMLKTYYGTSNLGFVHFLGPKGSIYLPAEALN